MRAVNIAALSLVAATLISAQTLPYPPNTSINIGEHVSQTAATVLAGRGITLNSALSTRPSVDAAGREIVWRQIRAHVDNRAGRHVFYRQHLLDNGADAEIYGSEVGVHSTADGSIWSISGHQFSAVTPTNHVMFDAGEAVNRARARLVKDIAFRPEAATTDAQRDWRIANSELRIAWDGSTFRYAWFTYTRDDQGNDYDVVIDAENERILGFGDGALRSNCYPSGPWSAIGAIGVPVRPDLANAGVRRGLLANSASDRPWPFTHEAFNVIGTNISILQETATTAFQCDSQASRAYTIVPLMADSGTVTYRDRSDQPEWRGSAAGDALFNTGETLAAFATLGRNGWNGSNSDANVVLDSSYYSADNAYFRMTGNGDPTFPPTPWVGVSPSSAFYNLASGLDVIAHEWGHGVISTSANFPCITPDTLPCQLHEGWADVIGNTVEKLRQPAGSGIEQSSDWTIHEDNGLGGYHRGALDDGDTGHTWTRLDGASIFINQTIHRQDAPLIQQSHLRGNMLTMVLRLATEGGQNPICTRHPEFDGCTGTVTALGLTKATQILFDALQYYTPSTARFEDLATYASQAAFDRYSNCYAFKPYMAIPEQSSISAAFASIGYPRLTGTYTCQ